MHLPKFAYTVVASALFAGTVVAAEPTQKLRILSANTAVETGLINSLAKKFTELHPGVTVEVEAAGALSVLDRARQGKGDLVITHHPRAEELFVSDDFGINRTLVMYNSFAILGPKDDPLGISKERDLSVVLRALAKDQVMFVVPGRRSGTTTRLNELWSMVNADPSWAGYEITEESAKATIQNADNIDAYTFADLGTYFANQNSINSIRPLYRDNVALNNYYSAIVVNGKKVPGVNQAQAEAFLEFLVSDRIQDDIRQYGMKSYNTELYTPAALLDKGLRERRFQTVIDDNNRNIRNLTILSAVIVVALLGALFLYLRTRQLARRYSVSEERFRLAAEGVNDGLYDWDIKKNIAYFSPQFRALLGIAGDAESFKDPARTILDYMDITHRRLAETKLNFVLSGSTDNIFSVGFRPANPKLADRWLLIRGRVIRDSGNKPIRMCGVLVDMTESNKPEEPAAKQRPAAMRVAKI